MTPTAHVATVLLFADRGVLEALGRAFREGPSGSSLAFLGLGTIVLVAVIVVIFRLANRKPRDAAQTETDIFTTLLDLLELAPAERADLQFVAAHRGDACAPTATLLTPRNFALAAQQACVDDRDEERLSRLGALCMKLFDERMPACAPPSPPIES